MKFTLTYEGELPSSGNSSKKVEEKWTIRKQISPQLADLWKIHPALIRAMNNRVVPKTGPFNLATPHHTDNTAYPTLQDAIREGLHMPDNHMDLCASIPVGKVNFRPLVRDSYALACSLHILFMRKGAVGKVYQGGDLDNRIKTLLDALSVPDANQVCDESELNMHCLLENDRLVTGLTVETRQLLNRPGSNETEVKLFMDVAVSVTDARTYNTLFLGD
ncbi:MAG: hypothetical protein WC830_01135 [Burkholderiales bacterium]|jgi:hypothetical protein